VGFGGREVAKKEFPDGGSEDRVVGVRDAARQGEVTEGG